MVQRRRVKVYFDGGCQPNPGAMEVAVVARGVPVFFDNLGSGSSSDAEWLALRLALQHAQSLGAADFVLVGDSLEVIRQAGGMYPCRSRNAAQHLARYLDCARLGAPRRIIWTPRGQNLAGIALARRHAGGIS